MRLSILGILAFVLLASVPAYALQWTARVPTDEGVVTKIVTDFSNPIYYPLWALLASVFVISAKELITEYKKFMNDRSYAHQIAENKKELELKDIKKNFQPQEVPEEDNSKAAVIDTFRNHDPKFSLPVFLEFAERLFIETFPRRTGIYWEGYSYYVEPFIIAKFVKKMQSVTQETQPEVKMAGIHIVSMESFNAGTDKIELELNGLFKNHGEKDAPTYFIQEWWTFERYKGVKSKSPEAITNFVCPVCGSTENLGPDENCVNCSREIGGGRKGWMVTAAEQKQFFKLSGYEPELSLLRRGGGRATFVQKDLDGKKEKLLAHNEDLDLEALQQSVMAAATSYYKNRYEENISLLQKFSTKSFYEGAAFQQYLLRKSEIFMEVSGVRAFYSQLSRINLDPWYDTVIIRVWMQMDLALNKEKPQEVATQIFSDYITLIKRKSDPITQWKILFMEDEANVT